MNKASDSKETSVLGESKEPMPLVVRSLVRATTNCSHSIVIQVTAGGDHDGKAVKESMHAVPTLGDLFC